VGAGADDQVTALLDRDPGARVAVDHPGAVAVLRETGMDEQVAVLASRLLGAAMFELFYENSGPSGSVQFGQEADGSPAESWAGKI